MYINAKNIALRTTNSGNQSIGGVVGGVRTGTDRADIFNGVKNETLIGGAGDDAYNLWDSSAKIVENAGGGVETVYVKFWGGYKLPDNVENVFLQSGGANWATGNALDNLLVAGALHATLDGGAGDDVLVGGAGADIFKIAAGNGSDVIYNFRAGWDVVQLTGYGYTSFDQLKARAAQVGADVAIKLSGAESLVLRDVKLDTLSAADFNLPMAKIAAAAGALQYGANRGYNANGWYVATNAWGSTGMTEGKDYTLNAAFKTSDMTKGTAFNWSYALNTDVNAKVLAFPEVIFGVSPFNSTGKNPTDTKLVLPVKVGDITALAATYDVSYSGNTGGFNVAYDIWLTSKAYGDKSTITNEIMVWVHKGDFPAHGTLVGTYQKGDFSAKIYHSGTYTALVADKDVPKGTIDIADIIKTLQAMGYVSPSEYVASVELGAEVVSGAGSLTINNLNLTVSSKSATGGEIVKSVSGANTLVAEKAAPVEAALVAKSAALSAAYTAGESKIVDGKGLMIGSQVTIVDGDKATVTKSDLAGKSLGRDVAKLENGEVVIHHFDGAGKAAGFEKVAYGADGVVTTRHYSSLNVFQGSEKMSTDADGVTTIKHYSASNVFTGAETVSTDLAGVTTTKVYDASFVMVSLQKVTPKDDGAITVQTFDRNIKMTSMDVIRTGGGATTTYHYDKNAAFTGYDVATLDDNGVTTTASYNTSYRLVETSFTGSDRADVLTGSSGVTHFHGGLGSDQLTGGGGVDYFHFDTAIGLGDVDTIANFTLGKDKIVLDLGVFQGLTSGALDPNVFVASGQALDAGDRVLFTQATGQIWYDADGTGVAAPVLIGQVSANAALTAMDFLVG